MIVCIGTLRNNNGTITKYRIINTGSKTVSDIASENMTSFISKYNVRNLKNTDKIECTEGRLEDYPCILGDRQTINNVPVVIETGNNITIANIEGKIVTLPEQAILDKLNSFANADIVDGNIVIKKSKVSGAKNILKEIMEAEDIPINITGFNMMDYMDNLGVSNDIFKPPSEIFKQKVIDDKTIESDINAYKFEIVKVEDRVELRKYIGEGYKGQVIIPDGVTHICREAFLKAKAEELIMPDTVVFIGEYAFKESHFKTVRLSKLVTAIPLGCFFDSRLVKINLDNITSIDNMAFCRSNIEEVHLKANIIQIGFEAFKDCKALHVFEHNKTIRKIRHHAFANCINLISFDFDSVDTLEQYSFNNTGIIRAKLNGEVNYLQTGTITGNIEEIVLLDNFYKIAADSISNIHNKPITWTVPNSVTNIEKGAFKNKDTVICYRKSVAASSAILAEANIIYLDDLDKNSIPNVIKKAQLLDVSVDEILRKTLKKILDSENEDIKYDIDESKLVRADIPNEILNLIGKDFIDGKYASDDDISSENIKFKAILEHLSKVARFEIYPFSSTVLELQSTFRVERKNGKLETLYDDGKSKLFRIVYLDNKFLSINSSFLVAKTYDTLRYICMDNKYTDIMCENSDVKDLKELLKVLRPGDTIGLNNIISGVKYPEISEKSSKEIETSKSGRKMKVKIEMNLYQALRYSSVTLRIDNNNLVLLLPGNETVIKCASLGRTVWLNEKEETYKTVQCTIDSIENIKDNSIFDYESSIKGYNYGTLLKRFKLMQKSEYQAYIDKYSHIYKASQSMYKHAGNYAHILGMKTISDVDINFMLLLFKTSLFEERPDSWLEGSIGKTIVPDAQSEFELSDGSILYQYRTAKKTALRNKLMSGGDRKLYIFELVDSNGIREGVYISTYDIISLVNMCININDNGKKRIFEDKTKFDTVSLNDVIEVATMCRDSSLSITNYQREATYTLSVYKPNGVYYIGVSIKGKDNKAMGYFIPLIQIGELDVALEFVEDTNKYGLKNEDMRYLYDASLMALSKFITEQLNEKCDFSYSRIKCLGLLKARELCIDGKSDINEFNTIGLPELLKRCMGYTDRNEDCYAIPEVAARNMMEDNMDDIEITDEDIGEITFDDEDDFDISEDDLGDI